MDSNQFERPESHYLGGRQPAEGHHSSSYTIKLWQARTGEEIATLNHADLVNACAYSPDGRWIVSASSDGTIRIWQTASGEEAFCFFLGAPVVALCVGRAGRSVAAGDTSGVVCILRVANLDVGPPVVTAVRLWRKNTTTWRQMIGLENEGWDRCVSAQCKWCGRRFQPSPRVLDTIARMNKEARFSADESPCASLPVETWAESALDSHCLRCHQPLRFNPFIVDNRDRY